jgi:hypothetical protein
LKRYARTIAQDVNADRFDRATVAPKLACYRQIVEQQLTREFRHARTRFEELM